MKTDSKPPKNGYELLHQLFQQICKTAPECPVIGTGLDLIADLNSGPNKGQAVRLCFEDERASLEFHSYRGSALEPSHEHSCWSKLQVMFRKNGTTDAKRGDLLIQEFYSNNGDIAMMTIDRRKILPFVIDFHAKIEQLPCFHTWLPELRESVHTALWQLEYKEEPATV